MICIELLGLNTHEQGIKKYLTRQISIEAAAANGPLKKLIKSSGSILRKFYYSKFLRGGFTNDVVSRER